MVDIETNAETNIVHKLGSTYANWVKIQNIKSSVIEDTSEQ